jgi:hypothetical protein
VPNAQKRAPARSDLLVRIAPESDPRDLGVTEPRAARLASRRALTFFREQHAASPRSRFVVDALPFDTRYVLLAAGEIEPAGAGRDEAKRSWTSIVDRRELVEEVVLPEARASTELGWSNAGCAEVPTADGAVVPSDRAEWRGRRSRLGGGSGASPDGLQARADGVRDSPLGSTIAYLATDPDAGRIAERLASRASASGPFARTFVRTLRLDPLAFRRALERGDAAAYVFAMTTGDLVTCADPARLCALAPWIRDGFDDSWRRAHPLGRVAPTAPDLERFLLETGRVIPLLETRSSLVRPDALGGVRIDGAGVLRFEDAGWVEEMELP